MADNRYLDDVMVRDLPEKQNYSDSDYVVIEGTDGTKLAKISTLMNSYATKTLYFDTLSDLQKANDISMGCIVTTLGNKIRGDGGGARYLIADGSNATANGTTIIAMTIQYKLKAFLIIEPEMAVEQFGAIGDRYTDDSASIKAAMDNCDVVNFHAKEYFVNSAVTVPSDTVINGGQGKIVSGFSNSFSIEDASNISIKDLGFGFKNTGDGVLIKHSSNILISNCEIEDVPNKNGILIESSENVTLDNLYITGVEVGYGVRVSADPAQPDILCKGITIKNSKFVDLYRAIFTEVAAEDINVYNCEFEFADNNDYNTAFHINGDAIVSISDCSCVNGNRFLISDSSTEAKVFVNNIKINNTANIFGLPQMTSTTFYLSGYQHYYYNDSTKIGYVVPTMNGNIQVHTGNFDIEGYVGINGSKVHYGTIHDTTAPELTTYNNAYDVAITGANNAIAVTSFRNTTYNVLGTGVVETISAGLVGQVISLISGNEVTLSKSAFIGPTEEDATLHIYKGIKLMYTSSGKWVQI